MSDVTGTGSCLCGTVRYAVRGPLRAVVACHCTQCRKQTGHFLPATDARRDEITIEGEANLEWYRASDFAARAFCRTCGSVLFWQQDGAETTSILAGTLDDDAGVKLERHIFVGDKGRYYEITDGLPQYDEDDHDGPPRPRG